jgi:hypothetical protein
MVSGAENERFDQTIIIYDVCSRRFLQNMLEDLEKIAWRTHGFRPGGNFFWAQCSGMF